MPSVAEELELIAMKTVAAVRKQMSYCNGQGNPGHKQQVGWA
jgi:hypothetical protein